MKNKKKNRSAFSITNRDVQEIQKKMGLRFENIRCCGDGGCGENGPTFSVADMIFSFAFACEAMSSENLFKLSCLFTFDSYLLKHLFLFFFSLFSYLKIPIASAIGIQYIRS